MSEENPSGSEALSKLSKDLKAVAKSLSRDEARFLVGSYYQMQENRLRAFHQIRQLNKMNEPHETLSWLEENSAVLERSIKNALDSYSSASVIGRWAKSIYGIGPVIAAGFLAHIDITKAPTAGHIWSFAGLNPLVTWEKGQKRPWNADLKTLCWKVGESFVKVSSREDDFYGHLYVERKVKEQIRNFSGELAEQATAKLAKFKIGKDTEAYTWYSGSLTVDAGRAIVSASAEKRASLTKELAGIPGSGVPMLPPGHIHARAKRWAVKLFISHYQAVAYRDHYGVDAPKPYILTRDHGHAHEIKVPNWPF